MYTQLGEYPARQAIRAFFATQRTIRLFRDWSTPRDKGGSGR
jgi:hypothetical protein